MQPKKSRRSLAFTGESSSMSTPTEKEEKMLRRLNADDLPQTGLQVKVVYLNPSGNVHSVTRPMNGSEAAGDLVSIQTPLFLSCKSCSCDANWPSFA